MTDKTRGVNALLQSVSREIKGAAGCVAAYARLRSVRRIGRNVTRYVKRNPMQSMAAVAAIGFLGGALTRRR